MDFVAGSKDNDLGTALVALAWTLFSVASCIIALRLWTRVVYLKNRMALHDWLMICAWISEVIHCIMLTLARNRGLGRHVASLTPDQIIHAHHLMVVSEAFSVTTSYFGRISFSVFMLSVIGVAAKPQKYTLWGVIIVNTVINAVVIIQIYTQCGVNLQAHWNPAAIPGAVCQDPNVETYLGYAQASLNSLCDLILTILPLTIVYKLNMPRATKIALGALLALSSFALIASVAKAIEIRQLSNGPDFTFNFAVLQITVVLENDIVMMAASFPMLRALWIKDKANSHPSYGHYSSNNGIGSKRLSGHRSGRSKSRSSLATDEEHMLEEVPNGGIQRTRETEVQTTYVKNKEEDLGVSVRSVGTSNWS